MRVIIDGKCLLPPRGGVARYLEGLLVGLAGVPHPEAVIDTVAPPSPRRTLPWVLGGLRRASHRGADVLHCPFYYPPPWPGCPVVVVLHDVLFLEHPEWFSPRVLHPIRLLAGRGARRAAAVVTATRTTAALVVERCRVPAERVRVIPYGLDHTLFTPAVSAAIAATRRRFGLDRPYVLQVGAADRRRGVDTALAAVARARRRHGDLELILVGGARAEIAALDHPPAWVRRLGWVDDADLPALYTGAAAVLAPSRGEGFDLPVLEALACGAPVVASDIPVHTELFAGAVELFPVGDGEAASAALVELVEDSDRAARLVVAGRELARRFEWEEAARRHLELWWEVARR